MKSNKVITSLLVVLAVAVLAIATIITVTSGYGVHFTIGRIGLLLKLFLYIGVFYAICQIALRIASSPKIRFPEAKPEDFPETDHQRLAQYSRFLAEHGFVRLRDYTVAPTNRYRPMVRGFARVFVNPELRCFAEVGQIFTKQPQSAGMHCDFLTWFKGGLRYETTDRIVSEITYIARRPDSLWLSRPGMDLDELLSLHRQMVSQITMGLNLSVLEDVTLESFYERIKQGLKELHRQIMKQARWLAPLFVQFNSLRRRRHYGWLGDHGLNAPLSQWTPEIGIRQDNVTRDRGGLLNRWSPTINLVSTIMLGMSTYEMLMNPTHNPAVRRYRMILLVLGLLGYALASIGKHKPGATPATVASSKLR